MALYINNPTLDNLRNDIAHYRLRKYLLVMGYSKLSEQVSNVYLAGNLIMLQLKWNVKPISRNGRIYLPKHHFTFDGTHDYVHQILVDGKTAQWIVNFRQKKQIIPFNQGGWGDLKGFRCSLFNDNVKCVYTDDFVGNSKKISNVIIIEYLPIKIVKGGIEFPHMGTKWRRGG